MKTISPIFGVVTRNHSDSIGSDDVLSLQPHLPQENKSNKPSKKYPPLFTTVQTATKFETIEPQSLTSIWNAFKPYVETSEINVFIKKEIFVSLIFYINNLISMLGINDKLLQIYDEIFDNLDKEFNVKLLQSSLRTIFTSDDIKNIKKGDLSHNKKLVKLIYEKNYTPLVVLFNKTFLESLMHFRGSIYLPELRGFEYYFFLSIKKLEEEKKDKDYIQFYIDVLNNYEIICGVSKGNKTKGIIIVD